MIFLPKSILEMAPFNWRANILLNICSCQLDLTLSSTVSCIYSPGNVVYSACWWFRGGLTFFTYQSCTSAAVWQRESPRRNLTLVKVGQLSLLKRLQDILVYGCYVS